MRIAFFGDNAYPEMSGIVDSMLITGRALEKKGHKVIFVGPRYASRNYVAVKRTAPESHTAEKIGGMPIVRLPSLPLPNSPTGQSRLAIPYFGRPALMRALQEFAPDIIHTHSPYGVGLEAIAAAKKLNVPLVGTNHTPIEEYFPVGKQLIRRYDAWYYNHCVFMSTPYAELIAHMQGVGFRGVAREIPNPIELSLFSPADETQKAAAKAALDLNGPTVLYVGNFFAGKRINLVIDAIAQLRKDLPNISLMLVGRGAEEARLRSQVARLGLEKNILFAGYIPMTELSRYYQAADVFAIMSEVDTQSLALMQAFASGIPAVGGRARGLPDFLPQTCGFLVPPGSVQELTEKLKLLLADTALCERMGRAGLAFTEQFAPTTIAARWEKQYGHELVKKKASPFS